ncbi:MAG: hypothetical protein IKW33_02865 [Clostridia bacterium]|nr:hypothetical protein [Clostridia bacterium]
MRCFIHNEQEAISVCKNCGKAMCERCSAYSGHTGVCPECRKKEFEQKERFLLEEKKSLLWSAIGNIFLAVLLCWTIIGLIFFGVKTFLKFKNRKEIDTELANLSAEITKLDTALKNRSSDATL